MRTAFLSFALGAAAIALSGCETAGVNEGPVEYALRPDYRDVYRRPVPPPVRYVRPPPARPDRYDVYRDDLYDRPPPPRRPYRNDGYYDRRDGDDRYDRY